MDDWPWSYNRSYSPLAHRKLGFQEFVLHSSQIDISGKDFTFSWNHCSFIKVYRGFILVYWAKYSNRKVLWNSVVSAEIISAESTVYWFLYKAHIIRPTDLILPNYDCIYSWYIFYYLTDNICKNLYWILSFELWYNFYKKLTFRSVRTIIVIKRITIYFLGN